MKKTVFVGKVNDQEFDNVQDYNACVQAMIDMGQNFQATSSTQVVDVPEDDCECTCSGKDERSKCNCAKKPLKAVSAYLPAYELRNNGEYIDALIGEDSDEKFDECMNNLDTELQRTYDAVVDAIPHNTDEQLKVYTDAVADMRELLNVDLDKTNTALAPIVERINVLEDELDNLYETRDKLYRAGDVITTYKEFYDAVANVLCPDTEPNQTSELTDENEYNEAAKRLTAGFKSLLEEIFNRR